MLCALPPGEAEELLTRAIDQVLPLNVIWALFEVQLLQARQIASDQQPAKNQQLLHLQLVLRKRWLFLFVLFSLRLTPKKSDGHF